jgi:hypothetical protein
MPVRKRAHRRGRDPAQLHGIERAEALGDEDADEHEAGRGEEGRHDAGRPGGGVENRADERRPEQDRGGEAPALEQPP